jgi:predicted ATPase
MINSLHLGNFKGIRRADIGLERLTVIVGPNASGKTSILEALHHLSQLGAIAPNHYFAGPRDPSPLYRRSAATEGLELSCSGTTGDLRLCILPSDVSHDLPPKPLLWTFQIEGKEPGKSSDDWQKFIPNTPFAQRFRPADLLRLDPSIMVSSSHVDTIRMGSNGLGLASTLAFMALNQPDDFQLIKQRLSRVVPTIDSIRFQQNAAGMHQYPSYQLTFDFRNARDIPAPLVSEGTILVLGLLTALMGDGRPDLILLDDLDRGLHPKAQREVVDLLRLVLDQNPDLQIVATTHSPYLVDCLRPEEVRLTTLGDDGTVSCASLVEHPDFDKWKDEMAPGEMWSLFGEKWVGELQQAAGEK